jgi:hypothetical protein
VCDSKSGTSRHRRTGHGGRNRLRRATSSGEVAADSENMHALRTCSSYGA